LPIVRGDIDKRDLIDNMNMASGSETILVVDDDESIRNMIIDTLQPLGYNILTSASAREALDLSRTSEEHIDLILSDVIMPGMNGRELADAIRMEQPGIKIVLMSGYTDNVIAHHGALQMDYILINKPLLPIFLANKIREVLDQPPPEQTGETTAVTLEQG
jgi:two-component system, cell cycle sensor histidine kinase and response regulator CckA